MSFTPTLIAGIVAGTIAGGASAFVISTQLSQAGGTAGLELPGTPDSDLEGAVELLRQDLARIGDRLSTLEMRTPTAAPRTAQTAPVEGLDEIRDLLAALQQPNAPAPPQLRSMVERALADREAEEKAAEEARREQQLLDRLDERVAKLATDLGLDANQAKLMKDTLYASDKRRGEMFAAMRNGDAPTMDRDAMRASMEEFRDGVNAQLQTFLTPAQFDAYQESNDGGFGRGGFGGFGGGRGGGRGGD